MKEDNLVENLQCTIEAWWKLFILYQNDYSELQNDRLPIHDKDLMMTEEVPHGYVPVFQTMIYFIDQSYMKPSKKTSVLDRSTFEIKHYIICDEDQKGESGSQIYISTNEQISKHFGKASIQDERVCVLKIELMETTSL